MHFRKQFKFSTIILTLLILVGSKVSYAEHINADSMKYYYKLSYRYYTHDSNEYSMKAIQKTIYYSDTIVDKAVLGKMYGLQGYIFLSQGVISRSLTSFAKSKNIGIEVDNDELILAGYHGMGRTYIAINDFDNAQKNLEMGLVYAKKTKMIGAEAVMYNALGMLEDSKEDYTASIYNFTQFLNIAISREDTVSMIYAYVNLGEVYLIIDSFDSAYYYINLADKLNNYKKNVQAAASIYGNYGNLAFKRQNYQKSIDYLNSSMKICFDNNFSEFITENYYTLIENYKAINNFGKAIDVYNQMDHYKDSIHEINDKRKYAAIHSQIVLKEKEAQAKFWEQRYRNRNIILLLSIALTLVVVILLAILFRIYKSDKTRFKIDRKSFSDTIDEKNRELVTSIISKKQNDSFMELINESLNEISDRKSIDDVKQSLQDLKRKITLKGQITNNWEGFKIQFQKVHPEFFNLLLKVQSNLTQNELRMCAYIKMNMSTKEIANILNISDRSIQTSRYRLKKKLNLNPEIDLTTYIQAI